MTGAGMILGTAAYMSPEQAKGKPADKRSDIWAFGCVLYEMLTGTRPFDGEDVADTLAAVLRASPDWSTLPALPHSIDLLLHRSLEKDRRARLGDIAAVRLLLTDLQTLPPPVGDARGRRNLMLALAGIAAAALVGVAAIVAWRTPPRAAAPITRLQFPLPNGVRFTNTGRQVVAMSPDGRQLAFVANGQLWVKAMDQRDARPLTDGALAIVSPVFSPDSQSIAYWAASAINRVAVVGGSSIPLTSAPLTVFGMHWADDGIYYSESSTSALDGPSRIRKLSPSGGLPSTLAESPAGEGLYGPWPLPGGRGVLITQAKGIAANRWDTAQVIAVLPSGERRVLVDGASDGRYLPNGWLTYSIGGVVFGAPFDLDTLRLTRAAVPVLEGVGRASPTSGASQYAVSNAGTLAFVPGPAALPRGGRSLARFSMDGTAVPLNVALDQYEFPRVAPDGKRLAVGTNDGKEASIWIVSIDGSPDRRRLTTSGRSRFPIWSPDGRRVAFQSDGPGESGISWQASDGSGRAEPILKSPAGTEVHPGAVEPGRGDPVRDERRQ